MEFRFDKREYRPALFLVAADLSLIAVYAILHISTRFGLENIPPFFDIQVDQSISESFNTAKWLTITVLLLVLWHRTRMTTAAGFAVAFTAVTIDDLLNLHERGGQTLARQLDLSGVHGLRGQDFGELIVWAGLGVIVVAAIGVSYWIASADGRRLGRTLLLFFGALVTFAVGFDMVHSALDSFRHAPFLLGIVEDGGEMVTGSLCLAWCLAQVQRM